MTIVAGFVCNGGITIASDSRTTLHDGSFRDTTPKIRPLAIGGNDSFLISAAGHDHLAARAIEIVEENTKGVPLTKRRTIADLVESSIAQLKTEIRKQFQGTSIELQQHFRDYSFELMVAHYFDNKPCLFTLDFELGSSRAHKSDHVAMGCGRLLAEFCLDGLDISAMHSWETFATAIYVVEQVKKFDGRCGGPIQLGHCFTSGGETYAMLMQPGFVEIIAKQVIADTVAANSRWKEQVANIVKRVDAEMAADVEKLKQHVREKWSAS